MCEYCDYDEDDLEELDTEPFCSFCGVTLSVERREGRSLVAGPAVYICKACNTKAGKIFDPY